MEYKKQITVIGVTGNIGVPVVKNLISADFRIKAIVRNTDKAKKLFDCSEHVEVLYQGYPI